VLVWLMLLALPFQGVASAAMSGCAHGTPAQQHALGAPALQEGHCHSEEMQAAPPEHGPGHQSAGHDRDGSCSACAACCLGAAMAPPAKLAAAPPDAPTRFLPAALGPLPAVDLDLPERPPRFPLA